MTRSKEKWAHHDHRQGTFGRPALPHYRLNLGPIDISKRVKPECTGPATRICAVQKSISFPVFHPLRFSILTWTMSFSLTLLSSIWEIVPSLHVFLHPIQTSYMLQPFLPYITQEARTFPEPNQDTTTNDRRRQKYFNAYSMRTSLKVILCNCEQ